MTALYLLNKLGSSQQCLSHTCLNSASYANLSLGPHITPLQLWMSPVL